MADNKPVTQRHVIGRYRIDEPRPGNWRLYQGQPNGSIYRIGDFESEVKALVKLAKLQHGDLCCFGRELKAFVDSQEISST